ncbi:MAG: DUF418 domain-containing protein [Pseudomonadota bacterium]
MTDTVMTTAAEPDGAPRLAGLDILRGIAILGILFMNINAMGGATMMGWFDIWRYGHSAADEAAFFLRNVFADGTARCLLEMLFGVGMMILTTRAADGVGQAVDAGRARRVLRWMFGPWAVMRGYYWRNFVLFLFGLVHVFIVLWMGDILHTYGIAAMIAFLFRRTGPKTMLAIGLSMALFVAGAGGYGYWSATTEIRQETAIKARQAAGAPITADEKKLLAKADKGHTERAKQRAEFGQRMTSEDRTRGDSGTFATWAKSIWDVFFWIQAMGIEVQSIWEAAATMLVGGALFQWGIIQGRRSSRFYATLLMIGYAIGIAFRLPATLNDIAEYKGPQFFWFANEFARLAMTLGHVSLIHLLLRSAAGARLLRPFEAVGRTALTVYILQSIICLWILYPPFALGLYATQGWAGWMLTALAINVVLTFWANWYVQHYRIAPVEWAWRSIIAGKVLPIRKAGGSLAGGSVPIAA